MKYEGKEVSDEVLAEALESLSEAQQDLIGRIQEAEKEFTEVYGVLLADTKEAARLYSELGGQFYERSVLRALFVLVEGTVNCARHVLLTAADAPGLISSAEVALLRQEFNDLNDKGHVVSRPHYQKLRRTMLFVSRLYADLCGSDFEIDKGGTGWESFLQAIQFRNGITHPGPARKLELDKNDHEIVVRAMAFIWDVSQRLFIDHFVSVGVALRLQHKTS